MPTSIPASDKRFWLIYIMCFQANGLHNGSAIQEYGRLGR